VQYTERLPPPPLDQIVHCFWFLRGNARDARAEPVVCDGRIDIILHFADPFARVHGDGSVSPQADALVAGQLTAPLHIVPLGEIDVVGIRLRTAAASALLRAPLAELTDDVAPLSAVDARLTVRLREALSYAQTADARAAALAPALASVVRGVDPVARAAVCAAGRRAPSVREFSREARMSVRSVERRVLAATGLAPVALRKALRFRRAFRMLEQTPCGTWSRVAQDAGYFDQAHMIREFRAFAGDAPSRFFQRDPALARAFLGANA